MTTVLGESLENFVFLCAYNNGMISVGPKPCGDNANYTNLTNLMRIFLRGIGLFSEIRIKKNIGSTSESFSK